MKNQSHPKHNLESAAAQNTRNRQAENDLQYKDVISIDLLAKCVKAVTEEKDAQACCNFIEHKLELEESAIPHRHMTPHKSDACRKEIETLLEYDMIGSWACGVVMAKKIGDQLRFCCDFRYLNSVTVKDAYPIPRIDESF